MGNAMSTCTSNMRFIDPELAGFKCIDILILIHAGGINQLGDW